MGKLCKYRMKNKINNNNDLEELKQVELKYKKETWVWKRERSKLKCSKILELFRIMLLL